MNNCVLPAFPDERFYWKFNDSGDGIAWSDNLILYRKRKFWFDKHCGSIVVNAWRADRPLTADEILNKARKLAEEQFLGPLSPITGYRYRGKEY